MGSKKTYIYLGLFALLLISVGFMYVRDTQILEDVKSENQRMSLKITESEQKQKDAIIQKRISEQLEEIAQQQKVITENQKTIALEQRSIAEQKQFEAIVQKQVADKAKTRAENAFQDAEQQRKIAVLQKDAAEKAEKNANRLRMLSLGQSLSARSINLNNTGNDSLASMLALSAWQFISDNNGDLYQSELFQALKASSKESNTLKAHQGFIRDLSIMPGSGMQGMNMVSVDQNGEIIFWTGPLSDLMPTSIWKNQDYDLRNTCFNLDGSQLAVSDAKGNIIVLDQPYKDSKFYITKQSDTRIRAMVYISGNKLAFTEDANILGMDTHSQGSSVQQIYGHSQDITALLFSTEQNTFFFSDDKGATYSLKNQAGASAELIFKIEGEISSLCLDGTNQLAVGTNSGRIYVYDARTRATTELIGHVSQVNDLAFSNDLLISLGYDKTVRLWNLKSGSAESIVIEEQNDWAYCLNVLPETEKVISAGADKQLRITTINPRELADLVAAQVKRDFTQEEWNTYVDPTIELKSFKEN